MITLVTRSDYEQFLDALVRDGISVAGYQLREQSLPGVLEITIRVNWWSVFFTNRLQAVANALYGSVRKYKVAHLWVIIYTTPFPIRWRWMWAPLTGVCTEDSWLDFDAPT